MRMIGLSLFTLILSFVMTEVTAVAQDEAISKEKDAYVHAVTRGAGWMPWQERGISEAEEAFRAQIEARKDEMLRRSRDIEHPVIYTSNDIAQAKENAETSEWAQSWIDNQVSLADYIVEQPDGWIESMIPEQAPAHAYGFTCPNCVGEKSQEAVGGSLFRWSYRDPDVIECRECGQMFPDEKYPETATLVLPRTGHEITYYLNEAERNNPDNRTGELAWHWVGHPIHVSFTGVIREQKIKFMFTAARSLGFAYAFTDDPRYAAAARDVLVRYAECYRQWPYRDYWDAYADCDPMYAAYHDENLPIEWKRHLSEDVYARDTMEKASMLQSYWGAGRVHPSTDAVSALNNFAISYDLTCSAKNAQGANVWSESDRRIVERDLLLEYIMGAEPYVGGPGKAELHNNKAPRIYSAMAFVAQCLGIPAMADTALRGYEAVRDASFNSDGFCTESPSYNNMYLGQLLVVPEALHGFQWPKDFGARSGTVDYYANDTKLRRMYRAVLWTLLADGNYVPLSDTHVGSGPSTRILQMGLKRYPEFFSGTLPFLGASTMSEYALFGLSEEAMKKDTGLDLPETYFPDWQTAIMRNGSSPGSATLAMPLNPWGGHRHYDNLAVYYEDGGDAVLGDLGYVGDMPVNSWIKSTQSHNLVIVDGENQRSAERKPVIEMMATTPLASVVEASSNPYNQCSEYRRRIALIKSPDGHTFAVDIFRVTGGAQHAYRIYSEVAASDRPGSAIAFDNVNMPAESPLPEIGNSLEREDIYGIRDVRSAPPNGASWHAIWSDDARAYRLWMLSAVDTVEVGNGPGQRDLGEAGRRVRYVNAIRTGENLESDFVAVHEPSIGAAETPITAVERLDAAMAGPDAVALRIETKWGTYYVLNDFTEKAETAGVTFKGKFAVLHVSDEVPIEYATVAASDLAFKRAKFEYAAPYLEGSVETSDESSLTAPGMDIMPLRMYENVTQYVRIQSGDGWKAYPVALVEDGTIRVKHYPLPPKIESFQLPVVRYAKIE